MKYCSHCGAGLKDQDKFCHKCGHEARMLQPTVETQPVEPPKEKGSKKKVIRYAAAALLLIIVSATAFFMLKPSEPGAGTEVGIRGGDSEKNKSAENTSTGSDSDAATGQQTGPVEADYVLVNRLEGGIFYQDTALAGTEYGDLRTEATSLLKKSLLTLYESASSMSNNGLDAYSNHLASMSNNPALDQALCAKTATELGAVRGAIKVLETEIEGYKTTSAGTAEVQAMLDYRLMVSVLKLRKQVALYEDYISDWQDYIAYNLSQSDLQEADTFVDECDRIFDEELVDDYAATMSAYLEVVRIYNYIASADYVYAHEDLSDSMDLLAGLPETEDVKALKAMIDQALVQDQPSYMIQMDSLSHIESKQNPLLSLFSLPVYAAGSDEGSLYGQVLVHLLAMEGTIGPQQAIYDVITAPSRRKTKDSDQASQTTSAPTTTSSVASTSETSNTYVSEREQYYSSMYTGVTQYLNQTLVDRLTTEQAMDGIINWFNANAPEDVYDESGVDSEVQIEADSYDGVTALQGNASSQLQQLNDLADSVSAHGGDLDEDLFAELISDLADTFEEALGTEKHNFINHCINTGLDQILSDLSLWATNYFTPGSLNFGEDSLTELLAILGIEREGLNQDVIDDLAEEFDIGASPTESDLDLEEDKVAVVLPAQFYSSENMQNILKDILTTDPYEVLEIDDNYQALIMSEDTRLNAVTNLSIILDAFEDFDTEDEEDPYILAIDVYDGYKAIDIYVADREKKMFDGMGVSLNVGIFGIYSITYQLFEQIPYEEVMLTGRTLNIATNAVIEADTYSPKARAIEEKVEEALIAEAYKDRLTTEVTAPTQDQYVPSGGEILKIKERDSEAIHKIEVFNPAGGDSYNKTIYTYDPDSGRLISIRQGTVNSEDYNRRKENYNTSTSWRHFDDSFVNNGYHCTFNEDGFLVSENRYMDGKQNGYRSFHDNGSLRWLVPYENSEEHGSEYHYDENGHLEEVIEHEHGETVRRVEFNPDGTVSDID